jgi:hypothetical protein
MRMRSEIVFEALRTTNRFAFCHLVSKAVRKLHKPSTRVQDTTNNALRLLAGAEQEERSIAPENANDAATTELGLEQSAIAS